MILTLKLLVLFSLVVILGFTSSIIYDKTRIPDIIWLLLFGIFLGPIAHIYDPELFIRVSPLMSIIALCIILFDAGINVDLRLIISAFPRSILLIALTYPLTMISIGLFLSYYFPSNFDLPKALLLGGMVGGTSTVTTIGIISAIEKTGVAVDEAKTVLLLESVLTDPISVITCITLLKIIMLSKVSLLVIVEDLLTSFINSIIVGYVSGLIWSIILDKLKEKPLTYIVTLAVVFLVYVASEEFGGEGSGALAVFIFSLVIANFDYIVKTVGIKRKFEVNRKVLREFHREITFLIKSFFFTYIGLIASISLNYIILGSALVIIILIDRLISASIASSILKLSQLDKTIIETTVASGLPALVMSQLPMIYDPTRTHFQSPEIYPNLCFIIVIGTVLFGAIVTPLIAKRKASKIEGKATNTSKQIS